MKTNLRIPFFILLFLLQATICISQITKQQAIAFVMDSIIGDKADSMNVYMEAGQQTGSYYILSPYDSIAAPYSAYWLFFIDQQPEYGWGHACEYIFINPNNGDYSIESKQLPPVKYTLVLEQVSVPINFAKISPNFNIANPLLYNYPTENHNLYAVMFTGGELGTGTYLFWNAFSHMYCGLREHGFPKENIYVLSNSGQINDNNPSLDLDNDSVNEILPIPCSKANVDSIFTQLANQMTDGDMLYVFVSTHGDYDKVDTSKYYFLLNNQEQLSNYDFAGMLEPIHCAQMIINLWSCWSGGFTYQISKINNPAKKTILTCIDKEAIIRGKVFSDKTGMDTYNYLVCTALRGWHPDVLDTANRAPWARTHEIGLLPVNEFNNLFPDSVEYNYDLTEKGGNNNGIQEMNEVINYTKGYDDPFNQHGSKVYENGFHKGNLSMPAEDLLSLFGITGKVQYSQTVKGNFLIGRTLSVEPGVELTMDDTATFYVFNYPIIIKSGDQSQSLSGGKLIINGGKLTSLNDSTFWKGIEVWGHSNQHQFTINGQCAQGTVQLRNGGTIENADTAINLWKYRDYTTTGGIVLANNANFINNKCGVNFVTYHNFNPNSFAQTNNRSYFQQCNFTTDTNIHASDKFYAFIKMLEVEGVRIEGCSFLNSTPLSTLPSPPTRGAGIRTLDAAFSVNSICTSPYQPCPPSSLIHTLFQGLSFGIVSANSSSSKSVRVFDSRFVDNDRGIYLSAVNNSTIVDNKFYVGTDNTCPNQVGIGIELVNSSGYSVENNYLTHSATLPSGNWYIGICIKHPEGTNITYDEVYGDTLVALNVGNQAEGYNYDQSQLLGLNYFCNINQSNSYDFYVPDYGITPNQGSAQKPAGNVFSHNYNSNCPYSDFDRTGGWWSVNYHYYQNSQNSEEEPFYYSNQVFPMPTNNQNTCPSNYNGSGNQTMLLTQQQVDSLTQEFANSSVEYDNVLALYESLKDGGNTEGTNYDITSALPDQTMQLRDELLGKSPHLSEEVLKNAIDKYDVLPDAILLDILSANPDELRNEELISYLSQRTPPFPDYMIDLLRVLAADTTPKTTLLQSLSFYQAKKYQAAYKLIRNSLNDSIVDLTAYRNWLDNLQNINADFQIIDSWLQEGNITSAFSLLDMLPSIYNLSDSGLIEYNYFKDVKTIQADIIRTGSNILQLDTHQIDSLANIAALSKGIAGTQAGNILEYGFDYNYSQCAAMINQNSTTKGIKPNTTELLNKAYASKVFTFPNPASNWTAIYYELADGLKSGTIEITNSIGNIVKSLSISNQKGEFIWDTRSVEPGVYIISCKSSKSVTTTKLTIYH